MRLAFVACWLLLLGNFILHVVLLFRGLGRGEAGPPPAPPAAPEVPADGEAERLPPRGWDAQILEGVAALFAVALLVVFVCFRDPAFLGGFLTIWLVFSLWGATKAWRALRRAEPPRPVVRAALLGLWAQVLPQAFLSWLVETHVLDYLSGKFGGDDAVGNVSYTFIVLPVLGFLCLELLLLLWATAAALVTGLTEALSRTARRDAVAVGIVGTVQYFVLLLLAWRG